MTKIYPIAYARPKPDPIKSMVTFRAKAIAEDGQYVRHLLALYFGSDVIKNVCGNEIHATGLCSALPLVENKGIDVFTDTKVHTGDLKKLETNIVSGDTFLADNLEIQAWRMFVQRGPRICCEVRLLADTFAQLLSIMRKGMRREPWGRQWPILEVCRALPRSRTPPLFILFFRRQKARADTGKLCKWE